VPERAVLTLIALGEESGLQRVDFAVQLRRQSVMADCLLQRGGHVASQLQSVCLLRPGALSRRRRRLSSRSTAHLHQMARGESVRRAQHEKNALLSKP